MTLGDFIFDTGNPSRLLQVQHGCDREGMNVRVVHPMTLLAEVYKKKTTDA